MFDTAFLLGPFAVTRAGTITLHAPAAPYDFVWRERAVHGCLTQAGLTLEVELGRVPSTAQDATARPHLLAAMQTLPAMLPPDWRLRLHADHRLHVGTSLDVVWPLSAVNLIVTQTQFLLALSPYLDVLEEAGVADC